MNRHSRRAARVRDPNGDPLECRLLLIEQRDEAGRPTVVRVCYDEQTIGDVVGGRRDGVEFLLVWMAKGQGIKAN